MNLVEKFLRELKKFKIKYCILRNYENLPKDPKEKGGDIDILVEKNDFSRTVDIVKKQGFVQYPFCHPHFMFFQYDRDFGWVKLDIIRGKVPQTKKFKFFRVPKHKIEYRLKKSLAQRVWTRILRDTFFLFRGRLICCIGPDGSGKSTISKIIKKELDFFPRKVKRIYFGTRYGGRFIRMFDLLIKVFDIFLNKILGNIIVTDRYIYLTFRKNPILSRIIRKIAPTPDLVFLMRVNPSSIRKRKDELSVNEIKEQYLLFEKIKGVQEIDCSRKRISKKEIEKIIKKILQTY
jgi:hypothetical protein